MLSNIIVPLPNKSVAPSYKLEQASGNLDDIEAPVVMIRRNYLDNKKLQEKTNKYNFQGKSAISKCLLSLYHEWLEEIVSICEPEFYRKLYKNKY